jgi:hypothetical protein
MSLEALTPDEIKILDAVKKSRDWREGSIGLCKDLYCTTGCTMIFRKLIKEAFANDGADINYLQALEPHLREKVRLFCQNRHDLLEWHELSRLENFCAQLDHRIPEEAQIIKKLEEDRDREYKQREEAWRKRVEEKRAIKKRQKQLQHMQRLRLKRERDHYYWIAYWAARHAIKEEKINSLHFKKRRKLISVYFFLKNYFYNLFAN